MRKSLLETANQELLFTKTDVRGSSVARTHSLSLSFNDLRLNFNSSIEEKKGFVSDVSVKTHTHTTLPVAMLTLSAC